MAQLGRAALAARSAALSGSHIKAPGFAGGYLLKVVEARKQRGIQDGPGRAPSRAIPKGEALLAAGTANQTKLVGAPVSGPV